MLHLSLLIIGACIGAFLQRAWDAYLDHHGEW